MTDFKKIQVDIRTPEQAIEVANFLHKKIGIKISRKIGTEIGAYSFVRYSEVDKNICNLSDHSEYLTYTYRHFKELFMNKKEDFEYGQVGYAWSMSNMSDVIQTNFIAYDPRCDKLKYLCSENPDTDQPECNWVVNFTLTDPRPKKIKRWVPATEEHIGMMVKVHYSSIYRAINSSYIEELKGIVDEQFVTVDNGGIYSCWKHAMIEIEVEEEQ